MGYESESQDVSKIKGGCMPEGPRHFRDFHREERECKTEAVYLNLGGVNPLESTSFLEMCISYMLFYQKLYGVKPPRIWSYKG